MSRDSKGLSDKKVSDKELCGGEKYVPDRIQRSRNYADV